MINKDNQRALSLQLYAYIVHLFSNFKVQMLINLANFNHGIQYLGVEDIIVTILKTVTLINKGVSFLCHLQRSVSCVLLTRLACKASKRLSLC